MDSIIWNWYLNTASSFETYSSETPEREFSRATAEETSGQQVIDDLKDAYTYLPETASWRENDERRGSAFR